MVKSIFARRDLLTAGLFGIGVSAVASRATVAAVCAPPNGPDSGLRESLHYLETAPDPKQRCELCGFFSDPAGGCGDCKIFNGPVNPEGHCDSFAAKG